MILSMRIQARHRLHQWEIATALAARDHRLTVLVEGVEDLHALALYNMVPHCIAVIKVNA